LEHTSYLRNLLKGMKLDVLIEVLEDLRYLERLNYDDFKDLLFPDSEYHYVDMKWELFRDNRYHFLQLSSNDKLQILVDYINRIKE